MQEGQINIDRPWNNLMARTSVKNGKTENYFWNIFRKEFGYDVAINYKTQDVKDQLAKEAFGSSLGQ